MMTVITQLFQAMNLDRFAIGQKRTNALMTPRPSCLLAGVQIGQPLRLIAVRGEHKVVHRLAELGLTPGVALTVVQATRGSFLVAVRGARIAIGRELAQQMEVALLS